MKKFYFIALLLFSCCLSGTAQTSVSTKPALTESEWTGFTTTIYLDTNNIVEHINDNLIIHFAISSSELSPNELKRRLEAVQIWDLIEYGTEGNLLVVKMKATKEDHKTNKLYLLKKLRCTKTIVNGNPMDLDKVKRNIKS
jgi:hypothetical protein